MLLEQATDQKEIDARMLVEFIPHSGPMVLLDRITDWDDDHIVCCTSSHVSVDNPLRVNGELSAVHVIEYGAQAASFHAVLISIKTRQPLSSHGKLGGIENAFLAVVRDFTFSPQSLDSCGEKTMSIIAIKENHAPRIIKYEIMAMIGEQKVASGFISLVIEG